MATTTPKTAAAGQHREIAPLLAVVDGASAAGLGRGQRGLASQPLGGSPSFAIAPRDGTRVEPNQLGPDILTCRSGGCDRRASVSVTALAADAIPGEFLTRGGDVVRPPEIQPYFLRDFSARQPDGHLLAFGHDISGASG